MRKYFDRGDYVLEITEHSPTERTKRMLPKPHTKGLGGVTAPVVPKPQPAPVARRIETKRKGSKRAAQKSRCVYLGDRRVNRAGEPQSLKVLCVTCQGAQNIDQPVFNCAIFSRCLPNFRPTGEAADKWFGNPELGIPPREESGSFHACYGCKKRRVDTDTSVEPNAVRPPAEPREPDASK
jgi:hypothetical protein